MAEEVVVERVAAVVPVLELAQAMVRVVVQSLVMVIGMGI